MGHEMSVAGVGAGGGGGSGGGGGGGGRGGGSRGTTGGGGGGGHDHHTGGDSSDDDDGEDAADAAGNLLMQMLGRGDVAAGDDDDGASGGDADDGGDDDGDGDNGESTTSSRRRVEYASLPVLPEAGPITAPWQRAYSCVATPWVAAGGADRQRRGSGGVVRQVAARATGGPRAARVAASRDVRSRSASRRAASLLGELHSMAETPGMLANCTASTAARLERAARELMPPGGDADDEETERHCADVVEFVRGGGMAVAADVLRHLWYAAREGGGGGDAGMARSMQGGRRAARVRRRRRQQVHAAMSVLNALHEVHYTLANVPAGAGVEVSLEDLATVAAFATVPRAAGTAVGTLSEALAHDTRVLPLSALRARGVDLVADLAAASPSALLASVGLLSFLSFDGGVQDPASPLSPAGLLRRSRDTATHAQEVVHQLHAGGGAVDAPPIVTTPWLCPAVPGAPVGVTPSVDANHAAIITAADGLLLHRLLLLLAAASPPPEVERFTKPLAAVRSGNLMGALTAAGGIDPDLLQVLLWFGTGQAPDAAFSGESHGGEDAGWAASHAPEPVATPPRVPPPPPPATAAPPAVTAASSPAGTCVEVGDVLAAAASAVASTRARESVVSVGDGNATAWQRLLLAAPHAVTAPTDGCARVALPQRFVFSHFNVPRSAYTVNVDSLTAHAACHAAGCTVCNPAGGGGGGGGSCEVLPPPPASHTSGGGGGGGGGGKDIFSDADVAEQARLRDRDAATAASHGCARTRVSFTPTPPRSAAAAVAPAAAPGSPPKELVEAALLAMRAKGHVSEVAFLLSALLSGGKRHQLQDMLVAHGALPIMSTLLHATDWAFSAADTPLPRLHGPHCTCRPETAGTVQVLRLLYCLLDRDCDSTVQRWLPRRRMLTDGEVTHAYAAYTPGVAVAAVAPVLAALPWAAAVMPRRWLHADTSADTAAAVARGGVNEAPVMTTMVRNSQARPWGWVSSSSAATDGVPTTATDSATFTAAAVASVVGGAGGSASSAPPHLTLYVQDPVLCSRNAAGGKPFDVDAIDSDSEGGGGSGGGGCRHLTPDAALTVDGVAAKSGDGSEASTLALAAAMSKDDVGPWCPELAPRPRGIMSLLLTALVLSGPDSPYRGWLSSCAETFLRAAPAPIRRWAAAHGLVRFLVRTLLEQYGVPAIKDAHALADADDSPDARSASARRHDSAAVAAAARQTRDAAAAAAAAAAGGAGSDTDADSEGSDGEDAKHSGKNSGGGRGEGVVEDDDSCEAGDEVSKYSMQAMFDLLGECLRTPDGMAEVFAHDADWTAARLPRLAAGADPAPGAVAWSDDAPGAPSTMAGTTLFRLAVDRLVDSNMYLRQLMQAEDRAYGVCAVDAAVGAAPMMGGVAPSGGDVHEWSWEALAAAGTADAPRRHLYPVVDADALALPPLVQLRAYRLPLQYAMLAATNLRQLAGDTVGVLNTTLLPFVVAHRHGALPAFVAALRAYDATYRAWRRADASGSAAAAATRPPLLLPSLAGGMPGSRLPPSAVHWPSNTTAADAVGGGGRDVVLPRFRAVLVWWLEYYSLRERDRRSFATSFGYSYEEWRVVVRALLGLPVGTPPTTSLYPPAAANTATLYGDPVALPRHSAAALAAATAAAAATDAALLAAWCTPRALRADGTSHPIPPTSYWPACVL